MPIAISADRSRPIAIGMPKAILLAVALVTLAEMSRFFTVADMPMSAIWPTTGIMLAAVLALGYRSLWITIPAVVFWTLVLQEKPMLVALFSALGLGCGSALAAWLMQRYWRQPAKRRPMASQLGLYTRCALAGGALIAALGALVFATAMPGFTDFHLLDIMVVYWAFEAMGIILFTPLAYFILRVPDRFVQQIREDWQRPALKAWLAIILSLIAAAWLSGRYGVSAYDAAIGFAFFPALCWFVLQVRAANVAWAIPAFAALFVGFSLHGLAGLPKIETVNDLIRSLLLVGGLAAMAQMIAAITAERMLLLREFRRQASTDYLTGLDNDRALATRLQALLETRDEDAGELNWLCVIQVLDFDQLEDLLGFQATQRLEQLLAGRLMGTVGPSAQPARIGDGTFVLVLQGASTPRLREQLDRIYHNFNGQVFEAGEHQTQVRVSLGAVPLDGNLSDHSHYLSAATQAALMSRREARRILVIENTPELIAQRQDMTSRLEALKNALSDDRLELFAQPIQALLEADEKLSFEILLRLRDRDGNLLNPGFFLPVAEAFGYMMEIDRWVIRKTLDTLAANPGWLARTRKCAINLAGTSLSARELVDYISAQLERTGVPPEKISFEITETESIRSREAAVTLIRALRNLGCSVSLDDFGTGLASFDYLRSFELDFLKIDGMFIKDLETSDHDRSMVRAICSIAKDMNLKTVAEFVESESLIAELKTLGVDYGQGYGIARPQPLAEIFNRRKQ